MKLSPITDPKAPGVTWYLFYCPGCKQNHAYTVNNPKGPTWTFVNGDLQNPTFVPSLLIYTTRPKKGTEGHERVTLCHLFLTDGKIQYLADCAHDLRGQTVDLPDLNDGDY